MELSKDGGAEGGGAGRPDRTFFKKGSSEISLSNVWLPSQETVKGPVNRLRGKQISGIICDIVSLNARVD